LELKFTALFEPLPEFQQVMQLLEKARTAAQREHGSE
jgi:hypothetical protein